jgi:hypothetical protein
MVAVMLTSPAVADTVTNLAYRSIPTSWSFNAAGIPPTVAPDGTRDGRCCGRKRNRRRHYVPSQVSGRGRGDLHFFKISPRRQRRSKFEGLHWQGCLRDRPKAMPDLQRPYRRVHIARQAYCRLRDCAGRSNRLVAGLGDIQAAGNHQREPRRFLGNHGIFRGLRGTA